MTLLSYKRFIVFTGTRADFGLLRPLICELKQRSDCVCWVLASGSHLSTGHGLTKDEIVESGIAIDFEVDLKLGSDKVKSIVRSMGAGLYGLADIFDEVRCDCLIVLGDRYEALVAALAAFMFRVPIAHVQGGEITSGALDDSLRHAITKLASLHFVTTEQSRLRVLQMGESPDRVHRVGSLGVDSIAQCDLMELSTIKRELGFDLRIPTLLITFHPETLRSSVGTDDIKVLLRALDHFPKHQKVFTLSNADPDGLMYNNAVKHYCRSEDKSFWFSSLGSRVYWSVVAGCCAVIGNSSSGIIEAPVFGVPTVNVGDRQRGRERARSVIDCPVDENSIAHAIGIAISSEFKESCGDVDNPYGSSGCARRISDILMQTEMGGIEVKDFCDTKIDNRSSMNDNSA